MKIDPKLTDEAFLKLLGERIAGLRLSLNLTQGQLAEEAGLGLRTVQRLELGAAATQLSGFVRVCRVLGLIGNFESLIPEPATSPIAQLKSKRGKRRRASGRPPSSDGSKKWTWGEPA